MDSKAIVCRGVTKRFAQGASNYLALKGVDLAVKFGELTLIVGPSGCGKTTLLSIIAGTLEPTSGEVAVLGNSLSRLSSLARISWRSHHVGFVFQDLQLLPALNAIENAALPLIIQGETRKAAFRKAESLLDDLGLASRTSAFPPELSSGQQQRVAIARALIHEPALILCDEPTSSVDAQTGLHVMELLSMRAVKPDRAVVTVTHDNRVFQYADRLATMNDGVIVSDGR